MTLTVNTETVKKITRTTFADLEAFIGIVLRGQTVYPMQMAVKFKIPLIVWGASRRGPSRYV